MSIPIWNKPLENISAEDLQTLLDQQVGENLFLEYKTLTEDIKSYLNGDFPKDVVALANAKGGLLVYGVSDSDGAPTGFPGIPKAIDHDDLKMRMVDALDYKVRPRLGMLVQMRGMLGPEGSRIHIVKVPHSLTGPHILTNKEPHYFPIRKDAKVAYMDYEEIRTAFSNQGSLLQRVVEFHGSRLSQIAEGTTPAPIDIDHVHMVMHLVPVEHFQTIPEIDFRTRSRSSTPVRLPTAYSLPTLGRFSPDGYLLELNLGDNPAPFKSRWYALVHWNSTVEIVVSRRIQNRSDAMPIPLLGVEKELKDDLNRALGILSDLEISPPFLWLNSIFRGRGMCPDPFFTHAQFTPVMYALDRDQVMLPMQWIDTVPVDSPTLVEPVAHRLWQCFGVSGSPSFPS